MKMTDIIKWLTLVAMFVQTLLSVAGGMIPVEISTVVNAILVGVFAFLNKIGGEPTE